MRAVEFITGHVIYNPAYTYKFQLKTTMKRTVLFWWSFAVAAKVCLHCRNIENTIQMYNLRNLIDEKITNAKFNMRTSWC